MEFLNMETCLCIPLRTGAVILGCFSTVFRTIIMVLYLKQCFNGGSGTISSLIPTPLAAMYYFIIILGLGLVMGYVAFPISFLYGIYKKRPSFMVPFIGENILCLVPVPTLLVASLALLGVAPGATFAILIPVSIYGGLALLYLRAIWSYHEVLRAEVETEAKGQTMELTKPAEDHVYPSEPPGNSSHPPAYSYNTQLGTCP